MLYPRKYSGIMRILLIGGTGILGRSFCRQFQGANGQVTAIVRNLEKGRILESLGVDLVQGSILDQDSLLRALPGHDVVINFASAIPRKSKSSARDWEMNDQLRLQGTANVLETIGNQPMFYCQAGIAFLYGDHKGKWVDESSATYPNAITRSAGEMERQFVESKHSDLHGVSFRFSAFYHEDAWHTQYMIHELQKRRVPIIGDGTFYWNLIHVDDAAAAVITVLENMDQIQKREIVNVSDGEPVQCREMLNYLAHLLSVHEPTKIPQFIARIVLGTEGFEVLTASYRCKTEKIRALGWKPRYSSYREGFASILQNV
jgi:nucleoside-diphosphate-sugar epimerase